MSFTKNRDEIPFSLLICFIFLDSFAWSRTQTYCLPFLSRRCITARPNQTSVLIPYNYQSAVRSEGHSFK